MAKLILEFDLDNHEDEISSRKAVHGYKLFNALFQISEELRTDIKYKELPLEDFHRKFNEILEDNHIYLNEYQ
ncbi:MAG: hypothetical protein ACK53T_07810 [Planctomycetota bacterium]|jgi:hypothetical protein